MRRKLDRESGRQRKHDRYRGRQRVRNMEVECKGEYGSDSRDVLCTETQEERMHRYSSQPVREAVQSVLVAGHTEGIHSRNIHRLHTHDVTTGGEFRLQFIATCTGTGPHDGFQIPEDGAVVQEVVVVGAEGGSPHTQRQVLHHKVLVTQCRHVNVR